jgi:hypothetical protein
MKQLANSAKRGCPTCKGKAVRECKACEGKTWMFDWWEQEDGSWAHQPDKAKR